MKKYIDEEEAEILQLHTSQKLVVSEARNEEITNDPKPLKGT